MQRYLAHLILISGDQLPKPWVNTQDFRPQSGQNRPHPLFFSVPVMLWPRSWYQSLRNGTMSTYNGPVAQADEQIARKWPCSAQVLGGSMGLLCGKSWISAVSSAISSSLSVTLILPIEMSAMVPGSANFDFGRPTSQTVG